MELFSLVRYTACKLIISHNTYLTQTIKDIIEERQHRASCHLGDVIKGFTSIVPHPAVLVIEASQHWRNEILQIQTSILIKNQIQTFTFVFIYFCVMELCCKAPAHHCI